MDITDYPPPIDGHVNDILPGITPPIITSLTPQQSDKSLSKSKIADKAEKDGKGTPRIRDVLDHILDLPTLVELGESENFPKSTLERGDMFCYLFL